MSKNELSNADIFVGAAACTIIGGFVGVIAVTVNFIKKGYMLTDSKGVPVKILDWANLKDDDDDNDNSTEEITDEKSNTSETQDA